MLTGLIVVTVIYMVLQVFFYCALASHLLRAERQDAEDQKALVALFGAINSRIDTLGARDGAHTSQLVECHRRVGVILDGMKDDKLGGVRKDIESLMRSIDIVDKRVAACRRDYGFVDEKLSSIWNAVNGLSTIPLSGAPRGNTGGFCGICGKVLRWDENHAWLPGDGTVGKQCDNCKRSNDYIEADGDESEVG